MIKLDFWPYPDENWFPRAYLNNHIATQQSRSERSVCVRDTLCFFVGEFGEEWCGGNCNHWNSKQIGNHCEKHSTQIRPNVRCTQAHSPPHNTSSYVCEYTHNRIHAIILRPSQHRAHKSDHLFKKRACLPDICQRLWEAVTDHSTTSDTCRVRSVLFQTVSVRHRCEWQFVSVSCACEISVTMNIIIIKQSSTRVGLRHKPQEKSNACRLNQETDQDENSICQPTAQQLYCNVHQYYLHEQHAVHYHTFTY